MLCKHKAQRQNTREQCSSDGWNQQHKEVTLRRWCTPRTGTQKGPSSHQETWPLLKAGMLDGTGGSTQLYRDGDSGMGVPSKFENQTPVLLPLLHDTARKPLLPVQAVRFEGRYQNIAQSLKAPDTLSALSESWNPSNRRWESSLPGQASNCMSVQPWLLKFIFNLDHILGHTSIKSSKTADLFCFPCVHMTVLPGVLPPQEPQQHVCRKCSPQIPLSIPHFVYQVLPTRATSLSLSTVQA